MAIDGLEVHVYVDKNLAEDAGDNRCATAGAEVGFGRITYDSDCISPPKYNSRRLSPRDLTVIGHELGHILSGHKGTSDPKLEEEQQREAEGYAGFFVYQHGIALQEAKRFSHWPDALEQGWHKADKLAKASQRSYEQQTTIHDLEWKLASLKRAKLQAEAEAKAARAETTWQKLSRDGDHLSAWIADQPLLTDWVLPILGGMLLTIPLIAIDNAIRRRLRRTNWAFLKSPPFRSGRR